MGKLQNKGVCTPSTSGLTDCCVVCTGRRYWPDGIAERCTQYNRNIQTRGCRSVPLSWAALTTKETGAGCTRVLVLLFCCRIFRNYFSGDRLLKLSSCINHVSTLHVDKHYSRFHNYNPPVKTRSTTEIPPPHTL